jgi:hypothetical protein
VIYRDRDRPWDAVVALHSAPEDEPPIPKVMTFDQVILKAMIKNLEEAYEYRCQSTAT